MFLPANKRKITCLKHLFFIPGPMALIAIFGQKQQLEDGHKIRIDPTGLSESGYSGYSIAHTISKVPKIVSTFETFSLYIHPKAIDLAKPSPGTCSELPNEPSCKNKFTQVAIFVFFWRKV